MHASSVRIRYALGLLPFGLALLSGCVDDSPVENDASTGGSATAPGGAAATGGAAAAGGTTATGGSGGTGTTDGRPRVVGYLPTWRSMDPAGLDLDTLTHICVAFANPTGSSVEFDDQADQV